MRLDSFIPARMSFISSRAPIYRELHFLKAWFSVNVPLSDWTLKYISTICAQPPRFNTLPSRLLLDSDNGETTKRKGLRIGRQASCSRAPCCSPCDVADISGPTLFIQPGRNKPRVDKIKLVRLERKMPVQIVDLWFRRGLSASSMQEWKEERSRFSACRILVGVQHSTAELMVLSGLERERFTYLKP